MRYSMDTLQELIDEEVIIKLNSNQESISGKITVVIAEKGILIIDSQSVNLSDIDQIYHVDANGNAYLIEDESFETSVYSDSQLLALLNEEIHLVKIDEEEEEEIELHGKVNEVDVENQLLYLEGQYEGVGFDQIISIKIKDNKGNEVELAPDNFLSAFDGEDQYIAEQFTPLIKQYIRFTYLLPESETDEEVSIKGQIVWVDDEEGGRIILNEDKTKYLVSNVLDCFLITNNGDEQYIIPAFNGINEEQSLVQELTETVFNYPHDLLSFFINKEIKIKGIFDTEVEIQGLLLTVNQFNLTIENYPVSIEIDYIDAVFVKQSNNQWDFIAPLSFDYRNTISGLYTTEALEELSKHQVLITYKLEEDGNADIPGEIEEIKEDKIFLKDYINPLYRDRIIDIYYTDSSIISNFAIPETGLKEELDSNKFTHNELLALLMRRVRLYVTNLENYQILEGMILKCFYGKGFLILAEYPNLAIPFSCIEKYTLVSN